MQDLTSARATPTPGPLGAYRVLKGRLAAVRAAHDVGGSAEEDNVLDEIDVLWRRMTDSERAEAELLWGPGAPMRVKGGGGERVADWLCRHQYRGVVVVQSTNPVGGPRMVEDLARCGVDVVYAPALVAYRPAPKWRRALALAATRA